jgi:hypothetical protein
MLAARAKASGQFSPLPPTRLDRAPEVKTIRRKLGELAAAGKAAGLIMALARRHAAAWPDVLGFLYVDGHARVYYGTRAVQKTHVARLKLFALTDLDQTINIVRHPRSPASPATG